MATYTKNKLSGSTDGKAILVAATTSPGTTIHTAGSGTTNWDEVWISATNNHTSSIVLHIQWGGTTGTDDIVVTLPSKSGLQLIVDGKLLQNSQVIKAYTETTGSVVSLHGFVNTIAP